MQALIRRTAKLVGVARDDPAGWGGLYLAPAESVNPNVRLIYCISMNINRHRYAIKTFHG